MSGLSLCSSKVVGHGAGGVGRTGHILATWLAALSLLLPAPVAPAVPKEVQFCHRLLVKFWHYPREPCYDDSNCCDPTLF
jgi:hypothetical protein